MLHYEREMENKIIIITGGNKGIGKGCSEAFCRSGASVVIGARDGDRGTAAAAEISSIGPGKCLFHPCDVSVDEEVAKLVDFTVSKFDRLDCIVNNAGYLPQRESIDNISVTDFERVVKTNLFGVFSGCKHALPHVRKTKGSIINISSILGVSGQEGSSIYSATKGAITAFTKSLAMDEAKNDVRVNVILPGNIKSELGKGNSDPYFTTKEDAAARSSRIQWIRRAGTALEIGWVAVFLSSSMASFMTGAEVPVTGGFELGNGLKLDRSELMKITASLFDD